jgi:mono/diheme cytochrome c family protein
MTHRSIALLLCVALIVGCKSHAPLSPIERGRRTFMRNCASCHGSDGKGLPLPGYAVPPTDLTSNEFQSTRDTEAIRTVLVNGKGAMPPLGKLLAEDELDELIGYVQTLGK